MWEMGVRGDDDSRVKWGNNGGILLNRARAADATREYYNWGRKGGYSRQSDRAAPAITADSLSAYPG